jgi:cation:H+ antiporter
MADVIFTQLLIDVVIIAVSFVFLNWASTLVINNAVKVSTITRLGKTAVGFSMIAFSTSLPELTVAFIAALSGVAALSVGNVLGSNIVNISVIVGLRLFLFITNAAVKQSVLISLTYLIVTLFPLLLNQN